MTNTRIYSYGASEPTKHLDSVRQQMRDAHGYRNWMAELERERREITDKLLADMDPKLAAVEVEIKRLTVEIEAIRFEITEKNVKRRERHCTPEDTVKVAALKKERNVVFKLRNNLRAKAFKSSEWEPRQKEINEWFASEEKARRDPCKKLLEWGTRGAIETNMKASRKNAPPRWRPFRGDGRLAVQVQKGISSEEAFACDDTRIQVIDMPKGVWVQGRRRQKKLGTAILRLRIGSDEKRKPIFAEIPFSYHRDLPKGSQIMWVYLIRRAIGAHDRWFVQFVIRLPDHVEAAIRPRATSGSVSIDVGWRVLDDRRLRVAVWRGSDGATGQLCLPHSTPYPRSKKEREYKGCSISWIDLYRKTEDIQSIRKNLFNEARTKLTAKLAELKLPTWFAEAAETLSQWKSQSRLARLVLRWRDARFTGDEGIFKAIEEWRKADKHLLCYEAEVRDQLQAQRLDVYRKFVASMRVRYAEAKIEKLDLREFHEEPNPEEMREEDAAAKKEHVRDAAVSILKRLLKESMAKVTEVKAAKTTRICSECGFENKWDDQSQILLRCESCFAIWDQDENATKNIASAEAVESNA